uniref:Uncharacterized protein n=1 Tax=Heterorhabditis bacteriophora TaxID=37862 RepID=A0A1I7XGQ8_HETBA
MGKFKKFDKWVPHELNEYQKYGRYEICFPLLLRRKTTHFLIALRRVTKNGFYTTTDGVPPSSWTKMKLQNTSPNRSCIERRLWTLLGGRQVESSTKTSCVLAKPSQERSIVRKSTKHTKKQQRLRPVLVNRKGPILLHD